VEKGGLAARLIAAWAPTPANDAAKGAANDAANGAANDAANDTANDTANGATNGAANDAANDATNGAANDAANDAVTPILQPADDPGIWFGDELRAGLHGQVRRVWAPIGEKVTQVVQIVYRWIYLALAVHPVTGALRWSWIANLTGVTLAPVLTVWRASGVATLVWDGAPGHRSPTVRTCGMTLVPLPPYAPELDPAARIFREIRREVEGEVYVDLAAKQQRIEAWLQRLAADPARVRALTGWHWLVPQLHAARQLSAP